MAEGSREHKDKAGGAGEQEGHKQDAGGNNAQEGRLEDGMMGFGYMIIL